MYSHHEESIARTIEHFVKDPEVLALILGGSIAHGFAGPASDVDVMMLRRRSLRASFLRERDSAL